VGQKQPKSPLVPTEGSQGVRLRNTCPNSKKGWWPAGVQPGRTRHAGGVVYTWLCRDRSRQRHHEREKRCASHHDHAGPRPRCRPAAAPPQRTTWNLRWGLFYRTLDEEARSRPEFGVATERLATPNSIDSSRGAPLGGEHQSQPNPTCVGVSWRRPFRVLTQIMRGARVHQPHQSALRGVVPTVCSHRRRTWRCAIRAR
jgi:hypothetical protein